MTKKSNILNADSFFGLLIFSYIFISVLFLESYPKYSHYFGLSVFGLAFIYNFILKGERIYINNVVIAHFVFILWTIISYLWAHNEEHCLEYQQRMIFLAILSFSFYNILKIFDVRTAFLAGVSLSSLINVAVFFGFIANPFQKESYGRFSGTMGNSNATAILLSFSIFATILLINSFSKKDGVSFFKWVFSLIIPLCLYLIVQTGSRKGFILGIVFLFMFFLPYFKNTKKIIYGTIILLMFAVGFNFLLENEEFAEQLGFVYERFEDAQDTVEGTGYEGSADIRLFFIKEGFETWKNNPVLGIGLNNFSFYYGTYTHNNFIEMLANLGIIGLILYYLIYLFCFLNVIKIKDFNLKVSGLFFLILFLFMDSAWVSYVSIPYFMMIIFVSDMISMDKQNREKSIENSNTQ